MRGPSEQGLQLTFDRFSAASDQEGTKISTKKIEVLCLAKAVFPGQTLKAVFPAIEHKYAAAGGDVQVPWGWVVFTSDESQHKGIDTRIGKANAVLRELYCSMVTKQGISNNANLSVFKSVVVPILTCCHESQVKNKRQRWNVCEEFSV